MSRIDRPLTNAPITIARKGSLRNTFVPLADPHGKQRIDLASISAAGGTVRRTA